MLTTYSSLACSHSNYSEQRNTAQRSHHGTNRHPIRQHIAQIQTALQAGLNATDPRATLRARQLTRSLTQHLYGYVRTNKLTVDKWMTGLYLLCHYSPSAQ